MLSPACLLLAFSMSVADPASWWKTYGDPVLDSLVERLANGNLDLKTAASRIAEARALTGSRRSALAPQSNATAGAQRLRGGFNQGVARIPNSAADSAAFVSPFETGIFQGGLDMRWELDLFGTNRAALAASRADVAAEEQRRADLLLSLSAELARNYMELRGVERRLEIVKRNVAAEQDLLHLTRTRAEAGLATELDVERQRLLLSNTEALLPSLEAERSLREHRIAVLIGESGHTVPAGSPALAAPDADASRISLDLLRRRPDVRAAEARVAAAGFRTKQARSDLYPKINLSGLMGRQGLSLSGLTLGGGNFFSIGPQLQLPLFNFGRIRSNIAAQEARTAALQTEVESELLTAWEEAANALTSYQRQRERETRLGASVASARKSWEMSQALQKAGLNDFLTVLDAERGVLQAELDQTAAHTQALVESVSLFKALAGGWPQ